LILYQAVGSSSGRFFSLNLILLEARAILDLSEAGLLNTETSLLGRRRGGKREEEQSVGKIDDERSRSGGPARDGSELRGFSAANADVFGENALWALQSHSRAIQLHGFWIEKRRFQLE
jgi:hypothetical protein